MGYVEVEEFVLSDGVDEARFRALDAAVQAWAYTHRPGLVRRTTALGAGREALVVTLFGGRDAPEVADHSALPVAALIAAIDGSTYRRRVYRDLD